MKILDWAKTAVYISLVVFLGFCSYAVMELIRAEHQITAVLTHADKSLSGVDTAVLQTSTLVPQLRTTLSGVQSSISSVASGLNQTTALINHPCVPGPCGTVADIGKTLNTTRLTLGQLEIAANHEDKNLANLDAQENQLFKDTDATVLGFSDVEVGLAKTDTDLDAFITSPDLSKTISNVQTTTNNIGLMSTDAQTKFHTFLYPPPCHGIRCRIGEGYTFVKDASSLAEPAYWLQQLFTGAKP